MQQKMVFCEESVVPRKVVTESQLMSRASQASNHAYNKYSNFAVGAAVVTDTGRIFTGCNVENASYGLTVCAERVAICKAVSEGYRSLKACWIHVRSSEPVYPCGACLQFLSEFVEDDLWLAGSCREMKENEAVDVQKYSGFLSEMYNEKFTREKLRLP